MCVEEAHHKVILRFRKLFRRYYQICLGDSTGGKSNYVKEAQQEEILSLFRRLTRR